MEQNPRPMATAPKDGTIIWLLIEMLQDDDCPISLPHDDNPAWTIGFNSYDNNESEEWNVVGWDWCQDEFTELNHSQNGFRLLGWLPCEMPALPKVRKHI